MTKYIVRTHEPYMPGQGPRSQFSEFVLRDKSEAQTLAATLNARKDGTYSHVVTVTGNRSENGHPYPVR